MHIENTLGRYYVHKDFWGKEKKYIMFEHVKLKELCTVNQGLQIPISKRLTEPGPNRYFYITVQFLKNNIENYYIENPPIATTCNKDEILMVRTGNTGQVITGVEGCFHNNFFKVKPNDRIIPKYLYYVLKSDLMYKRVLNAASGTTIPDLKHSSFYELDIPLPMIETQKKISEMLECIDKKIENNEAINRNLTEQFRAIVDDFVENLEDYRLMRLDEVAECQNGHAFYKDGYDESGAFVIDLGNVNTSANFVYTNGDKYISIDRYEQSKLEKYHVFKDDLVMVMTDRKSTMDLLGKTGKIYKDGYYLLNQRMYRIRAKDNINVNYLYAILNSSKVCNSLKEKALGSVQKYVNTKEINEIEIMLPTPEKMEELAQVVNPISSKMETNILENENLHNLRDELLPKLMSGELDVSDLDI